MNLLEELRWRGMVQDMTPDTEKQFEQSTAAYIGFDPTAASLHIGNLATVMLMIHLQNHGHTPVVVVGGATGMVGDPSGKKTERPILDAETLQSNVAGITKQLEGLLDFTSTNKPVVLNNYDWFKNFSLLDFLRDVGKYTSVNTMLTKDSVKNRLEDGISFTEFSYQLLQGYDFMHLYTNHNVRVQMGGSDQWGNMTAGTDLIRRMCAGKAYALTTPLLTKPDGSKFGKSESGNIWLDPMLTSPYEFYQFWLGVSDEEAPKLLRVFTLSDEASINKLEAKHQQDPSHHYMQKWLAYQVTTLVHGAKEASAMIEISKLLFEGLSSESLVDVDPLIWERVSTVIPSYVVDAQPDAVELLSNVDIFFTSKSDVKRMIKQKAVKVNGYLQQMDMVLPEPLAGGYYFVERGKKKCIVLINS